MHMPVKVHRCVLELVKQWLRNAWPWRSNGERQMTSENLFPATIQESRPAVITLSPRLSLCNSSLALVDASWFIFTALHVAAKRLWTLRNPTIRWIFTAVMVFAVVFCGLLSSNLSLHQLIHPDANNEHHQCAITIFAHGHIDLTDGSPVLAAPVFCESQIPVAFESAAPDAADYLLLPGRAPPVLAS
jgi:hypothetical protein